MIGGSRSDLLKTCMIDGHFGNVSAGVLFLKVVTWKAGCRRVAWASKFFLSKLQ